MLLVVVLVCSLVAVGAEYGAQPYANRAVLKDSDGMQLAELNRITGYINNLLADNVANDVLTSKLYSSLLSSDRNTRYLVALYKCFDYCFTGNQPKKYAVYDLDRNTTRLMVTGRYKC